MRVVDITIFPVKSARGRAVSSATLEPRGLVGDRRWMVTDPGGRFVSQRELPALALLDAEPTDRGLSLSFNGSSIEVSWPSEHAARRPAQVWDDVLNLPEASEAAEWLSQAFGRELRLVYQPDDARRPAEDWATPEDEVSLADGFPLLLATTASLAAVRSATGLPLPMERFRPNLVIDGSEPWEEDCWATLRIGAVELDLVKPCPRCSITTVDPATGTFSGTEPLATLRQIRMSADRRVPGVLFGWNAVPRRLGIIAVGDEVKVMSTRPGWPIRAPRTEVERDEAGAA